MSNSILTIENIQESVAEATCSGSLEIFNDCSDGAKSAYRPLPTAFDGSVPTCTIVYPTSKKVILLQYQSGFQSNLCLRDISSGAKNRKSACGPYLRVSTHKFVSK